VPLDACLRTECRHPVDIVVALKYSLRWGKLHGYCRKVADPMRYACYGLSIDSPIALPELVPAANDEGAPDVRIELERVPAGERLDSARQLGPYLWAGPSELALTIPGIARFLVSEGRRILVEPDPGIDEDSVRVFLLGSALGALLFQRGLLVLHGNAVRVGDACMVCVGPSGAGKSTLAAAFLQRGHEILADDVVPVDGECRALPGFARVKLWQDAADELGVDTAPLRRIRPEMEKFNYPVDRFADRPLPVRWIYVLDSHSRPDIVIEPIRGMRCFEFLHANTYRVRFLKGMGLESEHLRLAGKLIGRIRLARVTRSDLGFDVASLADCLLADIAENP